MAIFAEISRYDINLDYISNDVLIFSVRTMYVVHSVHCAYSTRYFTVYIARHVILYYFLFSEFLGDILIRTGRLFQSRIHLQY